jgi:hypothetical protein
VETTAYPTVVFACACIVIEPVYRPPNDVKIGPTSVVVCTCADSVSAISSPIIDNLNE